MLLMFLSDYSENVSVLTDYFSELVFYYNLLIDTDIIFPFGIIQYREIFFFHLDHSLQSLNLRAKIKLPESVPTDHWIFESEFCQLPHLLLYFF